MQHPTTFSEGAWLAPAESMLQHGRLSSQGGAGGQYDMHSIPEKQQLSKLRDQIIDLCQAVARDQGAGQLTKERAMLVRADLRDADQ
jgi:hypothetical protein